MARYLVTGGFGFIGSHLVKAMIKEGHEVKVVDVLTNASQPIHNDKIRFFKASIFDHAEMEMAFDGVDVCFHLTDATLDHDPRRNSIGTLPQSGQSIKTLFDHAHYAGNVPIVYASSAAVYGTQPSGPIPESAQTNPLNAHGENKLHLETTAAEAFQSMGVPSVGLRFFNLYGPTQSPKSIYCGVLRRIMELVREDAPVPLYGGGHQIRDFTHVSDAIDSMVCVSTKPIEKAQIFNICTGIGVSVRDVIDKIEHCAQRKIKIEDRSLSPTDVMESIGDPGKAANILNFRAKVTLSKGVAEMVDTLL